MQTTARLCLVLATATLLAGCATTSQTGSTAAAPSYTSALQYPDRLVARPDGSLLWLASDARFAKYKTVYLDRIRVAVHKESSTQTVDPAELTALTTYFRKSITTALGSNYPVVDATGPDTLGVRIVIYDLVPTNPIVSVGVLLTPYATIPDLLGGSVTSDKVGSAPYLGHTGIAVEFYDTASGKLLGEYVDEQFGRKYVVDMNNGVVSAVTGGLKDYANAYSNWAYAQQAMDGWSQAFAGWMKRQHQQ